MYNDEIRQRTNERISCEGLMSKFMLFFLDGVGFFMKTKVIMMMEKTKKPSEEKEVKKKEMKKKVILGKQGDNTQDGTKVIQKESLCALVYLQKHRARKRKSQ